MLKVSNNPSRLIILGNDVLGINDVYEFGGCMRRGNKGILHFYDKKRDIYFKFECQIGDGAQVSLDSVHFLNDCESVEINMQA